MREHEIVCPYCGRNVTVYGNGFYGTWMCPECSTDEEEHWFNWAGQEVVPPEQQVLCEDW